ncbi:MAG: hypothetical protein HY815_12005 [Candidatus Riflebacteria bacterium]|nr:hypothetical protein [Candidatus Riflebacteria bacterium]
MALGDGEGEGEASGLALAGGAADPAGEALHAVGGWAGPSPQPTIMHTMVSATTQITTDILQRIALGIIILPSG